MPTTYHRQPEGKGDDDAVGHPTRRLVAWILLGGFLLISGAARGVYAAHDTEPSARFELLFRGGLILLLWYWFVQQVGPYRPKFPIDMGLFVAMLSFAPVPYYLWKYERWRGLAKVVGLGAVYALSLMCAGLIAFLLAE